MSAPTRLERREFDVAELMARHPPRWRDRNKQALYALSCPAGSAFTGVLSFSRWAEGTPPEELPAAGPRLEARPDFFDYEPTGPAPLVEWHLNFADPRLFVAYASSLFAQDEMQVAEHPVLGALKEALEAEGLACSTVERGRARPVLVRGVERRISVATGADAGAGRPHGLYGNRFAASDVAVVRRAARVIRPPTRSNILCLAAPGGGSGAYERDEIEGALATAYSGFLAAHLESAGAPTVVHTGHWGCGAFGGNRELMAILQVVAARLAGLHGLVFHAGDAVGVRTFTSAVERLDGPFTARSVPELVSRLAAARFEWGVSDGN